MELGVVASSIMGGTVRVVVGRGVVEVEIAVMEEGSKLTVLSVYGLLGDDRKEARD